MKQLIGRLLIFFIGVPLIVAIIVFVPGYGNVGYCALVIVFSALAGSETAGLFKEGRNRAARAWGMAAGGLPPAFEYLYVNFLGGNGSFPGGGASIAMTGLLVAVLATEIFRKADGIPAIMDRSVARAFPLLYPGLLSVFLVSLSRLEGGAGIVLLFIAITFSNDSLAWAFGMLLGKKRNIVPVSPNKSLAGFIGGLAGSVGAAVAARALFPGLLGGSFIAWGAAGLVTGVAAILGDLAESALKRSAGVKDSGSIMPGRGGVLDSIDSLLFAAPVFYAAVRAMEAWGRG